MGRLDGRFVWCLVFAAITARLLHVRESILQRQIESINLVNCGFDCISGEGEEAGWANYVMLRLWDVIEPSLSRKLGERLNVSLQEWCPAYLESWQMLEITLGSRPPVIKCIRVDRDTLQNQISLELDVLYTPRTLLIDGDQANADFENNGDSINLNRKVSSNSTSTSTRRNAPGSESPSVLKKIISQMKLKEPKKKSSSPPCNSSTAGQESQSLLDKGGDISWEGSVVIEAKLKRGLMGIVVPLHFEDVTIGGRIRVIFEVVPVYPFIGKIDLYFLEPPVINFSLRPIKDTSFMMMDLMDLPGLSRWLMSKMEETMAYVCVYPSVVTIPIDKFSLISPEVCAIGVLRVVIGKIRWNRPLSSRFPGGKCHVKLIVGGQTKAVSLPMLLDASGSEWQLETDLHEQFSEKSDQVFYILLHSRRHRLILTLCLLTGSEQVLGSLSHDPFIEEKSVWQPFQKNLKIPSSPPSSPTNQTKIPPEINFRSKFFAPAPPDYAAGASNITSGIFNISVWQIKDLWGEKQVSKNFSMQCYYEIVVHPTGVSGKAARSNYQVPTDRVYRSKGRKRTALPSWDDVFEVFLKNYKETSVTIIIRPSESSETILGIWSQSFEKVVDRTDWFRFEDCDQAQFYASFIFRPVSMHERRAEGINSIQRANNMRESFSALVSNSRAIGVLTVKICRLCQTGKLKANGGELWPSLESEEVHVSLDLNGVHIGRTLGRSLHRRGPDGHLAIWDQAFAMLLGDTQDRLTLDLMGFDGRTFGRCSVKLDEVLITKSEENQSDMKNIVLKITDLHGKSLSMNITVEIQLNPIVYDDESNLPNILGLSDHQVSGSNCHILDIRSVKAIKLPEGKSYCVTISVINENHYMRCSANHEYRSLASKANEENQVFWGRFAQLLLINALECSLEIRVQDAITKEVLGGATIAMIEAQCDVQYPLLCGSGFISFQMQAHHVNLTLKQEKIESGFLFVNLIDGIFESFGVNNQIGSNSYYCCLRTQDERFFKSKPVKKLVYSNYGDEMVFGSQVPFSFVRCKETSWLEVEIRDWSKIRLARCLGKSACVPIKDLPISKWSETILIPVLTLLGKKIGLVRAQCTFVPAYHPEDFVECPTPNRAFEDNDFNRLYLESHESFSVNGDHGREQLLMMSEQDRSPAEVLIIIEKIKIQKDQIPMIVSRNNIPFEGELKPLQHEQLDPSGVTEWRAKIRRRGKTIFKTDGSVHGAWSESKATFIINSYDFKMGTEKDRTVQFILISVDRTRLIDDFYLDIGSLPGLVKKDDSDYSTGSVSIESPNSHATLYLSYTFLLRKPIIDLTMSSRTVQR